MSRASYWSSQVWWRLLHCHWDCEVMVEWGAARNVGNEPQSSICYHIWRWPTVRDVPNLGIGYVSDISHSKNAAEGPRVKCIDACPEKLRGGPCFAAIHQGWNDIGQPLIATIWRLLVGLLALLPMTMKFVKNVDKHCFNYLSYRHNIRHVSNDDDDDSNWIFVALCVVT